MAGRALAFSDAEIVRMATEEFVPVACDDWYQRRRKDAEGEFFKRVADQSPRGGDHSNTRQGIYLLTAGGKLLAYKNAGQNAEVMREVLSDALKKWKKLPEGERAPGAVKVPGAGKLDGGFVRKPPEGGLIVNVYARALEKVKSGSAGGVADAVCKVGDGDEASRDHLWIKAEEWRAMVPASAKVGDEVKVPGAVVRRIARFHLIDNTRGEPPMWGNEDVKAAELAGVVEKVKGERVVVKLEGKALLAEGETVEKAKRGFDAAMLGYVTLDRAKGKVERFDLVALGEHWGDGRFTRGAREGRTPFGVAFELASGEKPGDGVPPQGARWEQDYFRSGQ